MTSITLQQCRAAGHRPGRHSPDGVGLILECPVCCRAWLVHPDGEEIRLFGSYERRLTRQLADWCKPGTPGEYVLPAIPPHCAEQRMPATIVEVLEGVFAGRLRLREDLPPHFLIDTPRSSFVPAL